VWEASVGGKCGKQCGKQTFTVQVEPDSGHIDRHLVPEEF
jgi:hypothetical protein